MIALAQQSNILDEVIHGEALAVLRTLPDNSVDAIVCDPPAGISFMGKEWDKANYFPTRKSRPEEHGLKFGKSMISGPEWSYSKKAREAFISFITEIMAEALRVLKPGGHAFVWALPRTSHWTGMALEDAGFEIRDVVTHLFGSGFPKSANISKMIDRMAGAEREIVGIHRTKDIRRNVAQDIANGWETRQGKLGTGAPTQYMDYAETAPATPEASQWNGWGTSLKPSSENWWLCRKPLSEPTIAANVLKWGTGAINIDASRVGIAEDDPNKRQSTGENGGAASMFGVGNHARPATLTGKRFPANLLLSHSVWCVPNGVKKVKPSNGSGKASHKTASIPNATVYSKGIGYRPPGTCDEGYVDSEGMEQVEDWLCDESCPIRLLDEQSKGTRADKASANGLGGWRNQYVGGDTSAYYRGTSYHDEGGASRYFQRFSPFIYQAKASRSERNRGCEGLPEKEAGILDHRPSGDFHTRLDGKTTKPATNNHPTVKPLALCRYLVRLITPPGGIVLDCFAGSGSTLVAAIHEGMHFIGIEMNDSEQEPYVSIARARIEQAFRDAGKPDVLVPPAEEWECAEDCPIAALDKQSGILKSGGKAGSVYRAKTFEHASTTFRSSANGAAISDQGGASRFFTNLVQDGMFDEVQS